MAEITIRNLSEETMETLRKHASEQGLSLEAYVRNLLQDAARREMRPSRILTKIARKYFGPTNGVDLDRPVRSTHRGAPDFDQ